MRIGLLKRLGCISTLLVSAHIVYGEVGKPVPVVQAASVKEVSQRIFPGEIRVPNQVDIGFNVPGEIEFLDAKEGRNVQKGDLIARLDPRNYQYNVDMAKAAFSQSKLEYERQKELYNQHVVSKSVFDRVEAGYLSSQAQYNSAKKALEDTEIRAPFDGVVAKRYVENYTQVNAMRPVMALYNLEELEVTSDIPEGVVLKGRRDALQDIFVTVSGIPNLKIPATLSEFSVSPNSFTNTYKAVFRLVSPQGYNLLPGMSVSVLVDYSDGETGDLVFIPLKSVFTSDGKDSYVWVIPADGGHPEKREVTLGDIKGSDVAVVEVKENEYIATAGIHSLNSTMVTSPVAEDKVGLDR